MPSSTSQPSSSSSSSSNSNNNNNINFEISAFQRMLSASAGSLINSLAVTPFDVVRIRLQQQELLSPSSSSSTISVPKNCCRTQTIFWLSPTDCSHPCASIESATVRFNGTWQALKFIALNEGITTLWRGVSLALFITIPGNMVYFAGYDHLKQNSPIGNLWPAINPLIAGAISRTAAVVTVSPIELVKTRLQSMPATTNKDGSKQRALYNLLQDTRRMVKHNGISSLFRGLQLTLWRDVPFSAIYWLSYEFWKEKFTHLVQSINDKSNNKIGLGSSLTANNNKRSNNDVALVSFLSGSVSGTIAAICTNPFDVGKTRLQVSVDSTASSKSACSTDSTTPSNQKRVRNTLVRNADTGASASASAAAATAAAKNRPSMFKFLADIAKNEGFSALYIGLAPRILKIAPSCAVMISTYEISKNYFHNRSLDNHGGGSSSGSGSSNNYNNNSFTGGSDEGSEFTEFSSGGGSVKSLGRATNSRFE